MRWRRARPFLPDGLAIVGLTVVCLVLVTVFTQAGFHDKAFIYVVIEPGLTFSEIKNRFEDLGLVKDELVFLVLGRAFGIEHRAKAGRYRFRPTADMAEILRTLYRGATYREHVLIRPGKTVPAVAEILRREAEVDSLGFVTLARDSAFVGRLGVPASTVEGFLFPDTYDIEWQEAPGTVIGRMVRRFFRVFGDSLQARARKMGMSLTEAVTMASIIEKEAMLDRERARISAVFHNRLELGMKLQADPTVRYALGKWSGRVLYKDLKVDSPFNTYVKYGLPPHPICSPSLPSLVAAVYPLPGSREIYFVAQGDGSHFFSESAGEHNRAKARYRRYLETSKRQTAEVEDTLETPE